MSQYTEIFIRYRYTGIVSYRPAKYRQVPINAIRCCFCCYWLIRFLCLVERAIFCLY